MSTATMTLRNVPVDLIEYLKERAASQRRSLNSQAVLELDEARKRQLQQVTAGHGGQHSESTQADRIIADIQARFAAAPVLDQREHGDMLYDDNGLPR